MGGAVLEARDVHLGADTVDMGHTVGLPLLDPVHHRPHLLAGCDALFFLCDSKGRQIGNS